MATEGRGERQRHNSWERERSCVEKTKEQRQKRSQKARKKEETYMLVRWCVEVI